MSKILTAKFGFSTKDRYKEFDLSIKVSPADFRFYYNPEELPVEIKALEECPKNRQMYFESFNELSGSIKELCDIVELAFIEESKEKVILYSVNIESNFGDIIDFRFLILQKIVLRKVRKGKVEEDVNYYKERNRAHSDGYAYQNSMDQLNTYSYFDDDFKEMVWTKERELWFDEMSSAIKVLSRNIKNGIGKNPEILARRIDQGAKLLLSGGS